MDNERHEYLVSKGYAVESTREGHVPKLNGEKISYARTSRSAAWDVCDEHMFRRGSKDLSRD